MDLEKAMAPGSALVKSDRPDNIGWDAAFPAGDIDAVFAEAEVIVKQRIGQQRLFPTPMETRGCVADYVPFDNRVTLWTSTQVPHFVRLFVGGALGVPSRNSASSATMWAADSVRRSGPMSRNTWPPRRRRSSSGR